MEKTTKKNPSAYRKYNKYAHYHSKKKTTTTPDAKGVDKNKNAKKKENTVKAKRTKANQSSNPERARVEDGLVCSCDPGFVPLSFALIDGRTSSFERFLQVHIPSRVEEDEEAEEAEAERAKKKHKEGSAKENEKKEKEKGKGNDNKHTVTSMREKYREMTWFRVCKCLFGFLDQHWDYVRRVRELIIEDQLETSLSELSGLIRAYFFIKVPGCKVVTLQRGSASSFFKIDKRYHKVEKNVHDENKRQAVAFVMKNIDKIDFFNDYVKSMSIRTSHFSDCIINFLFTFLRHTREFEKGPFKTRSMAAEKKSMIEGLVQKSLQTCVKVIPYNEEEEEELIECLYD